jgi:hypothetical protein
VIDVIAVTTAKGNYMTTLTNEARTAHVTEAERAKPNKKARVARTRASAVFMQPIGGWQGVA